MKKKSLLISLLSIGLLLTACGTDDTTSSNPINSSSEPTQSSSLETSSSSDETIHVESVSLDKETLALDLYGTHKFTATISPSDATNKSVTWKSSNSLVVAVSDGEIVALGTGTATITVTTVDGKQTATCTVTVTKPVVNVTGVSLNKDAASVEEEKSVTLSASVSPWNATNKGVTWTSSDSSVATVSSEGVVTGINTGTSTITVTTDDGNHTATCLITVVEKTVFDYEIGDSVVKVLQNTYGKRLMCYTPVTNKGNVNITVSSCSYAINDLDGNLIQTISQYSTECTPEIIKPGETVYCHGDYSYSGSLTESELVTVPTMTVKNASSYNPKRLDVSEVSLHRDTYNSIKVSGKVTNNMEEKASLAYVAFDLYDSSNNYIFSDASVLLDDVPAGGELAFDVGTLLDSYFKDVNLDDCHVIVRAYEHQLIMIF